METKENKPKTGKLKKTATVSALALLTAASVTTGSLFSTPAALLSNDAPASAYTVTVDLDGADDDAGAEQDESDETRKRGGVRATLRARILRLPLAVRLLAALPLWALGSAILAAAGAAWMLLAPALGKVAGWALMLALLAGSFLLAAKAAFPDLPVKKLLNRRSLVALALGASALAVADAVFAAAWEDYAQIKDVVLSAGFFVVLSCAAVPFALREQKRRLAAAAAEPPKKPDKLVFTDGLDTYTVRVPDLGV